MSKTSTQPIYNSKSFIHKHFFFKQSLLPDSQLKYQKSTKNLDFFQNFSGKVIKWLVENPRNFRVSTFWKWERRSNAVARLMSSFRAELFLLMCVSKGRNYANDRILEEWFRNSIFDDKIGLKIWSNWHCIIQLVKAIWEWFTTKWK